MKTSSFLPLLSSLLLFPLLVGTPAQAQPAATSKEPGTRIPTQVYFGAYRNMDQLVEPDAKWNFVKQNMDGFIMHFGYWLNNDYKGDPIGVGKKLAAQLNPLHKNWMMEVGWPNGIDDNFDDMGGSYGTKQAAQIKQFERDTGIVTNEISCDLRLFVMRDTVKYFPDYNYADIYQKVLGDSPNYPADGPAKNPYWPTYVGIMNRELPGVKINVTFPPIYVSWNQYPAANNEMVITSPNNGVMKFEGHDFMNSLFKPDIDGYIADSPYDIMSNPLYQGQGYLKKVVAIQTWLHQRGAQFSHIINGAPNDKLKLSPTDWDAKYKENSLNALHLFQSVGGRADRYILESWYKGPYKIVPETEQGTYTNLVMDAIKYLKGTGQKLDLSVQAPAATPVGVGLYGAKGPQNLKCSAGAYQITIKNEGEVACMPTIRAVEKKAATNAFSYQIDGQDVGAAMHSDEGYVFTGLIQPGASATLTVTVAPGAKGQQVELRTFWNPQDGASPRDAIAITARS